MASFVEDESVLSRDARAADEIHTYGPDPDHVVEVWHPTTAAKAVVALLVHGGFWRSAYDRAHLRPAAVALADAGWPVALVEYRRIPGDPDATVADVRRAAEIAPSFVDGDLPVVTVGHSAGGHLVLWLAAASPPRLHGTLALAPVADLRLSDELWLGTGAVRRFVGVAPDQRPDIDPMRLPSPPGAVTVLHGAEDAVVPLAVARSYVRHHPRTRLVALPATGHYALIDPQTSAWSSVTAELDELSR
jgi:acetyl esterase/lipase